MARRNENDEARGGGGFRPLDGLLLALPAAFAIRHVPGWSSPTWLFVVSGLAIIPLARWMGRATEALGARVGHGVGGCSTRRLATRPN